MELSAARAAALTAWFDADMADQVTYNGSSIYAHVRYGGKNSPMADHATLTVLVSDVPAPSYRDTVVIDSTTWRVFQDDSQLAVIEGDGLTWTIPLTKAERAAL